MPRLLNPKLEPAAIGTAAATAYAAVVMLYRAYWAHTGVFDMDVLVAAVVAVYGLYVRAKATPLANPKDKHGRALVPARSRE